LAAASERPPVARRSMRELLMCGLLYPVLSLLLSELVLEVGRFPCGILFFFL
jgi:hypothetical protein